MKNKPFPNQVNEYHGKVRDVYYIDNELLVMIASDRISAFDVILPRPIPFKGQVLNQIAAYMLKATSDICPNWLLDIPAPNVAIGKKCTPFKIEMVVRGNLVGHAWRTYKAGGRILCGVALPEGMAENDYFPTPIITPSTKASEGHDEDISKAEIIAQGLATAADWETLEKYALALFARGKEIAAKQGLILVDTKYVREWLIENGFMGKEGQTVPTMTDEWIDIISKRYIELYEKVIGAHFKPEPKTDEETYTLVCKSLNKLS
jgi:phosphoribosylaminoimidazole-succinocarboxamide synthase